MWKVKAEIDFDFARLLRKMPQILKDNNKSIGDDSAKQTKSNIDTQQHLLPLKQSTINARIKGDYVNNTSVAPTSSTIPLKYTGELYNSIKGTKDGITMLDYGLKHHDGISEKLKNIQRPMRRFIQMTMGKDTVAKIHRDINKSLSLKGLII